MSQYRPLSALVQNRLANAWADSELARRVMLALESRSHEEVGKPELVRMLAELELLAEPARRPFRRIDVPKTQAKQTVMILPGFATAPHRMKYLAQHLEQAGHSTKRWGAGFNWGPTEERFAQMEARLIEIHAAQQTKIVLLGWSLGGLFAREIAKRHPDKVAKVITLGSPFSGSPRANNMWRVYQFVTGYRVDEPPVKADVATKPPVETIAFWSARDGAIAPHCAAGLPGERDRAVRIDCTHCGYTYDAGAILAILRELDRANSN
ncbi:MAG: alpha/beta fold hydrolase [Pseudomonadota bacterium]